MLVPYFKQTKKMHYSGFCRIEIGYISTLSGDKTVLYDGADIIHSFVITEEMSLGFSLDAIPGGEIRVISRMMGGKKKKIRWSKLIGSDVFLEEGDPEEHIKEKSSERG